MFQQRHQSVGVLGGAIICALFYAFEIVLVQLGVPAWIVAGVAALFVFLLIVSWNGR